MLRQGIGRAHDEVTTSLPEAQAFYDQGLAYLHSYVWIEAARSFNRALRIDPRLALAHLGLTYVYTELNAPPKAQAALGAARALASSVSDHERRHIEARALQMAAEAAPRDKTKLAAYRESLDAALRTYPADVELWLLRGNAESSDPADRGQGSVASAIPFYEKAGDSLAAHHYLAHAYENMGRQAEALQQAAAFARGASQVPHALHMHGHVLRRLGRIDEAIAAFEAADRLETEYFGTEKVAPEIEWHYEHNLDLLAASYQYNGQMAKAERVMRIAFELPSALVAQMYNKREWPAFLVSTGRTADALAAANVLVANQVSLVRATGHVAAGHALVAAGRFKEAADEVNAALREMKAAADGAAMVAPAFQTLQGEFFVRTGQRDKGRSMLQDVARTLRAAPGPDNWVQALFALEDMAQTGRDASDWELASWAAQQMLEHDPNYAGTYYALGLVKEHNGDIPGRAVAFMQAERLWSKADPSLSQLTNIRRMTTR